MKTNLSKSTLMIALTISVGLPQIPAIAFAKGNPIKQDVASYDIDMFAIDDAVLNGDASGSTDNSSKNSGQQNKKNNNGSSNGSSSTIGKNGKPTMGSATVPEPYQCPLFQNRPHAELIKAVDALTKEVAVTTECSNDPSMKSLQDNGKVIKDNIASLQSIMNAADPTQMNTAQIDQSMTAALTAVGNVGDILNNNKFLNSKCGRQTMSTGKTLLALNDVINGIAPYALFAVSMNAALAPALPFVVGGVVATSGISALAKMIDNNTLDMSNPDHRNAVLQNTCEFTKVAKKVRFMQLAQSGKIDKINEELQKDVARYKGEFSRPTGELSALLKYRATVSKSIAGIESQLASDRTDLATIDMQVSSSNDDLMVCTLSQELVQWSQDGKSFPASTFNNLSAAVSQGNKSQMLQAMTLRALHLTSVKRISELAPKISTDDTALRSCAQTGRSWLSGIRNAVNATATIVGQNKIALENELNQNAQYRNWKAQYNQIKIQEVTIQRVEKAMEDLAQDNSIIDRSELAQRMVLLKAGLFGSRKIWNFGKPPVLAWIEHTRDMHSQAISAFLAGVSALKSGAWSLTDSGQGKTVKFTPGGAMYMDPVAQTKDVNSMKTLDTLNLKLLPPGSRENEIACQQLEGAWLDWSAAMDHLGAIQFFCDMIDPVLDVKMDTAVVSACRGNLLLNGSSTSLSIVDQAKKILVSKGYQNDAILIGKKLKELQCPLPTVSVMNQ